MSGAELGSRLVIVAILTPRAGAAVKFREYETRAAAIMARYGGVIERTVTEEPSAEGKPSREVHLVSFPSREAVERYRADPELETLQALRAESIDHTELIFGGNESRSS